MKTRFTIGIFGIIFDDQKRVLLCHRRDYDLWNLPGGGLESGEAPWDGMKREVKEETGLDVEIDRLIGVYSKTEINEISFAFECKVISGQITLNDEADKIEYFAVEDLPLNMSQKQVERIKDALKNSKEVVLKIQTGKGAINLIKEKQTGNGSN